MVIMLRLKKVLIAILLLSVFAVGTLNFVDIAEAAKWKKFDSGKYYDKYTTKGYKKTITYTTYMKGSNNGKINYYAYRTKDNKKIHFAIGYASKTGNKIKMYFAYPNGEKTKPEYDTYKGTLKQYYTKVFKPINLK